MIKFIYCPTTGDRVFLEQPSDGLIVVKWGNGCRHVVTPDCYAHLVYNTSKPNFHHRLELIELIRASKFLHGAVAWDCNGDINIIASSGEAVKLDRTVMLLRECMFGHRNHIGDGERNGMALWLAGRADFDCYEFTPMVKRAVQFEREITRANLPTYADKTPEYVNGGIDEKMSCNDC